VTTRETVAAAPKGVTEVRGNEEFLSGGAFHVKTEYLKNGQGSPGHEITYGSISRGSYFQMKRDGM